MACLSKPAAGRSMILRSENEVIGNYVSPEPVAAKLSIEHE